MDRNITDDGIGKYALLNLRKLNEVCSYPSTFERWTPEVAQALKTLEEVGALEWGRVGEKDEFFVVKLKDKHSMHALMAYHASIYKDDPEFAESVREMAMRSGPFHPLCKAPD